MKLENEKVKQSIIEEGDNIDIIDNRDEKSLMKGEVRSMEVSMGGQTIIIELDTGYRMVVPKK